MAFVVVERAFDSPVTLEMAGDVESQNADCLDRHRVRRVARYVSPDGKRMICVFEAPDAEAVRQGMKQVGLPYVRLYTATFHAPCA